MWCLCTRLPRVCATSVLGFRFRLLRVAPHFFKSDVREMTQIKRPETKPGLALITTWRAWARERRAPNGGRETGLFVCLGLTVSRPHPTVSRRLVSRTGKTVSAHFPLFSVFSPCMHFEVLTVHIDSIDRRRMHLGGPEVAARVGRNETPFTMHSNDSSIHCMHDAQVAKIRQQCVPPLGTVVVSLTWCGAEGAAAPSTTPSFLPLPPSPALLSPPPLLPRVLARGAILQLWGHSQFVALTDHRVPVSGFYSVHCIPRAPWLGIPLTHAHRP
jgi:hypothetical protein